MSTDLHTPHDIKVSSYKIKMLDYSYREKFLPGHIYMLPLYLTFLHISPFISPGSVLFDALPFTDPEKQKSQANFQKGINASAQRPEFLVKSDTLCGVLRGALA